MPLTIPRIEELRERLYKRASRLADFARMGDKTPAIVMAHEVAMVVETASFLISRELVDRTIAERRQMEYWREAGLCIYCGGSPLVDSGSMCAVCAKSAESIFRQVEDSGA